MQASESCFNIIPKELTTKIIEKLEITYLKDVSTVSKLFYEILKNIYEDNFVKHDVKDLFQRGLLVNHILLNDEIIEKEADIKCVIGKTCAILSIIDNNMEDVFENLLQSDNFKTQLLNFTFEELREAHECYSKQLKVKKEDNDLPFHEKEALEKKMKNMSSEFNNRAVGKSFNLKKLSLFYKVWNEEFMRMQEEMKMFEKTIDEKLAYLLRSVRELKGLTEHPCLSNRIHNYYNLNITSRKKNISKIRGKVLRVKKRVHYHTKNIHISRPNQKDFQQKSIAGVLS